MAEQLSVFDTPYGLNSEQGLYGQEDGRGKLRSDIGHVTLTYPSPERLHHTSLFRRYPDEVKTVVIGMPALAIALGLLDTGLALAGLNPVPGAITSGGMALAQLTFDFVKVGQITQRRSQLASQWIADARDWYQPPHESDLDVAYRVPSDPRPDSVGALLPSIRNHYVSSVDLVLDTTGVVWVDPDATVSQHKAWGVDSVELEAWGEAGHDLNGKLRYLPDVIVQPEAQLPMREEVPDGWIPARRLFMHVEAGRWPMQMRSNFQIPSTWINRNLALNQAPEQPSHRWAGPSRQSGERASAMSL